LTAESRSLGSGYTSLSIAYDGLKCNMIKIA